MFGNFQFFSLVKPFALVTFIATFGFYAHADNPTNLQQYLRDFHANPKKVMNDRLPKLDENGLPVPEAIAGSTEKFSPERFDAQSFLSERNLLRTSVCEGQNGKANGDACSVNRKSEIPDEDRVDAILAGPQTIYKLADMERAGLTSAALPSIPWSDTYWPKKNGAIAWRYADRRFPTNGFEESHAYYVSQPTATTDSRLYSPAEKYDKLIGDSSNALTQANWQRGLWSISRGLTVKNWEGLCHGWAPAAFMELEPKRPVTVQSRTGENITFHPSDIKALLTSLWADSDRDTEFIGRKCKILEPREDEVGRVIDPTCLPTNPGAWHLSLVNRLGILKKSFVMDATYDIEVWNQPVYKYSYRYFNPQTLVESPQLYGTMIPIDQFRSDKFRPYRSPKTKYVVGIAMDLTYINENSPTTKPYPLKPSQKTVRYIYDLELDENHRIIGGEWYSNKHPDFLWAIKDGFSPRSKGEKKFGLQPSWNGRGPVPDDYIRAAQVSSEEAQPLAAIAHALLMLSRQ